MRNQSPSETIADYVAELRRLTTSGDFGAFLDDTLRDGFICGLRGESACKKLLMESKLTLATAVELAQCMELANKNAKSFKETEEIVQKLSPTFPAKEAELSINVNSVTDTVVQTMKPPLAVSLRLRVTPVEKRGTLLQPAVRKEGTKSQTATQKEDKIHVGRNRRT